jgi:molybdopterin biosynthesis enzyme
VLLGMQGHAQTDRPQARVRLAHDVTPIDRIDFMRVRLQRGVDGVLEAASTGPQQSSRLASLIGAQALAIIPPRERPYTAGEMVDALLLESV